MKFMNVLCVCVHVRFVFGLVWSRNKQTKQKKRKKIGKVSQSVSVFANFQFKIQFLCRCCCCCFCQLTFSDCRLFFFFFACWWWFSSFYFIKLTANKKKIGTMKMKTIYNSPEKKLIGYPNKQAMTIIIRITNSKKKNTND